MQLLKKMDIQSWRLRSTFGAQSTVSREASDKQTVAASEQKQAEPLNGQENEQPTISQVNSQVVEGSAPQADGGHEFSAQQAADFVAENAAPLAAEPLDWQGLQTVIEDPQNCPTCSRNNSLIGSGSTSADWVFVTDAPPSLGLSQDAFFTGRAGSLFDAILLALDLDKTDVYVTSIFKCAPTENLSATPQCNRLIERQLELLSPKVIVTFGEFSAQAILKANEPLETLCATEQRCVRSGIAVIPTFSPAQMLDEPSLKANVWKDLKRCRLLVAA